MASIPSILDRLSEFQQRDLFAAGKWQARGLNPSAPELSGGLANFFHHCARELAGAVAADNSTRKQKKILTTALAQLNKTHYDTEEREFIVDIFGELAAIIGVDIRAALSRWLNGTVLTSMLAIARALRPERVVEVLSQPCTQCGILLESQVMRKRADIPDARWMIIRCKNCRELNLLSPGPGIEQLRFGNYEWVESLSRDEYSHEQALVRLEQIRIFRNRQ
jgi:hypothetical protein